MRRSIRRRFATWVALAILGSIAIYGVVVYVLVSDEIPKIASGDPTEAGEKGGEEILESILLAGPIALVGGVAAALILTKRALAPIDDAVAAASELTANDLHRRLPVPAREDELRDLVIALNGLLGRLEEGFGAVARQAAEASHELRTPLTVIATELEVALRRPRDAREWAETATRTLDEVRRLSALVDALLELSRAGAVPAAGGGAVDVVAVAEQVCGGLAGAAEARGVALDLDACANAPVRGHGGALEGALRNLVGNALRFTPGGGRVVVRVAHAGGVEIHVDDSGPGVAPDERDIVFEPFHRGKAGADAPGLGLGLSIVRKVVHAHGGAIAIADSPLGGARFTITLPATAEGVA